ncbi:hypothetical protein KP509_20G035700 [Ceratopteris richardii]|uniref:Uncharacterized protein n=3 Tax=Ceratopteris richardii TaxID=49495 RepID=A0A8T2SED9_CERRI|nr:hypothetical protein KP509_20G035700 [Ceratopteris richardii]
MRSPRPKVPPYLLILVVSLALVGLVGYQTLKDRKTASDLLLENRRLKEDLQKEQKKANDLQEEYVKLSSQKEELSGLKEGLHGRLLELGREKSSTEADNKMLESSLIERESEIRDLKMKLALFDRKEDQIQQLKDEITRKNELISGLKARIRMIGGYLRNRIDALSTNTSAVEDAEGKHKRRHMRKGNETSLNRIVERKKRTSLPDEEDEKMTTEHYEETQKKNSDTEETNHMEMKSTKTKEHSENQTETSKDTQSTDFEDEESKVDDREDTEADDDADAETSNDEEADKANDEDADKANDEEAEKTNNEEAGKRHKQEDPEKADKTPEQEETDERADLDMDIVNKTDEENELAAME